MTGVKLLASDGCWLFVSFTAAEFLLRSVSDEEGVLSRADDIVLAAALSEISNDLRS